MKLPLSPLPFRTRAFASIALLLSVASLVAAILGALEGDQLTALLGATVSVFAGWMSTAIVQFHERMTAIDDLVEEGRRRIDHSDQVIGEVRRLAERARSERSGQVDRTVH